MEWIINLNKKHDGRYLIIIIERMLLKYYALQYAYRQKMNSMKLSHYTTFC
jgi:hypothetical protein